jgi:alpha-D-xyloside xylohydrolase
MRAVSTRPLLKLSISAPTDRRRLAAYLVLAALVVGAGFGLGWRAVERHHALLTNAEDLGFTDQIVWNFLRGHFFRFSTYQDAEFTTDIDLKAVRRVDSLLAFHVEPILLPLAPLYLAIPDVRAILWLQGFAIALGAIPAYRLAHRRLGSPLAGLAFAAVYLLAPLGQWAAAADFHSVALAAPLLLLAVDALDAGQPRLFLIAGLLAASTKEEIGLLVAGLGVLALLRSAGGGCRRMCWAGLAAIVLGAGWSVVCVGVIIPYYSGGTISPFTARYAEIGGSPGGALRMLVANPAAYLAVLSRPEVTSYLLTLVLAGGWLGLLAPELLLVAAPVLALNVFSNSPWMAAGRAHYSASLLPLLVAAAIVGAGRLTGFVGRRSLARASGPLPLAPAKRERGKRLALAAISLATVLAAAVGYHEAGIGPLVADLPAPIVLPRADLGQQLAASIPPHASVSASTTLYPHLSQRAGAYLFPTVHDAEYVFVDVTTPYPAAPGGAYERLTGLLTGGEYRLLAAEDGFVLLKRGPAAEQPLPDRFFDFARAVPAPNAVPLASFDDGAIEMLSAQLVPSSEVGPRGPLATLQTVWRVRRPVPERPRPQLTVWFRDGTNQTFDNQPVLWWYPPERWRQNEAVGVDVPGLALRDVVGWEADAPNDPPPSAEAGPTAESPSPSDTPPSPDVGVGLAPPSEGVAGEASPTPTNTAVDLAQSGPQASVVEARLGELTARVERNPWRLTLLDGHGLVLWQEAPVNDGAPGPLGYVDRAGTQHRLTRLIDASSLDDGLRLTAATDGPDGPDGPDGRTATVELHAVGQRGVRITFRPDGAGPPDVPGDTRDQTAAVAVGGAVVTAPGEHFLGFGERFGGVDQRGQIVRTWAEDRRDVRFGDATYAPIPWYISSQGYGMLVESDARGSFDVAATRPDRLVWQIERPAVSILVLAGPSPRDILQDLVRLDGDGRPPLPPIWAFGVWKTAIGGANQVLRDAERVNVERLPVSALLIYDLVDESALLGWPFVEYGDRSSGRYPDARALTDRLHALGFKALGYKNPDVAPSANVDHSLLVRDPAGNPYLHPHHQVGWVDFTNPAALAWWGGLWRRILGQGDGELGFDGAMLDLGELVPADARYADGTDGIESHNRYLGLYARASFEAARAVRGDDAVLFARSASRGARPYQSLQWSGDQTISWDQEGIRGLLPAALSLGLSGFPYWHPEVGGYAGIGLPRPSERELWLRWLQLGALSPLLRDNYGDHQGEPVEVWSDAETIAAFRQYAQLHQSLLPYLYTQAKIASETGLPIMRHLALSAPDDPRAWTVEDEYTLGDDLLVAPVLEQGARLRTVYLPAGSWVDWWTGRAWEGRQVVTIDAPLDRIPIFARAGAILPLATEAAPTGPGLDGMSAAWTSDLIVRVVAPADGSSPSPGEQRLYDGTRFRTMVAEGRLSLTVDGMPQSVVRTRSYQVILPTAAQPSHVLLDGHDVDGWSWSGGALHVTIMPGVASWKLDLGS